MHGLNLSLVVFKCGFISTSHRLLVTLDECFNAIRKQQEIAKQREIENELSDRACKAIFWKANNKERRRKARSDYENKYVQFGI